MAQISDKHFGYFSDPHLLPKPLREREREHLFYRTGTHIYGCTSLLESHAVDVTSTQQMFGGNDYRAFPKIKDIDDPHNGIKIPDYALNPLAGYFANKIDVQLGYIRNENIWFIMDKKRKSVLWSSNDSLILIEKKNTENGFTVAPPKPKRIFNRFTALLEDDDG